jgi:hypothetical protein
METVVPILTHLVDRSAQAANDPKSMATVAAARGLLDVGLVMNC